MIAEQVEHDIHGAEVTYDIWPRDRRDHVSVFPAMQATKRTQLLWLGHGS